MLRDRHPGDLGEIVDPVFGHGSTVSGTSAARRPVDLGPHVHQIDEDGDQSEQADHADDGAHPAGLPEDDGEQRRQGENPTQNPLVCRSTAVKASGRVRAACTSDSTPASPAAAPSSSMTISWVVPGRRNPTPQLYARAGVDFV